MRDFKAPVLATDSKGRMFVSFRLNGVRYRWFNGSKMNLDIHPNRETGHQQLHLGEKLRVEVWNQLLSGWTPPELALSKPKRLQEALEHISAHQYNTTYRKVFASSLKAIKTFYSRHPAGNLYLHEIKREHCFAFLQRKPQTAASFNTERKHLSSVMGQLLKPLSLTNPVEGIEKKKEKAVLHKPLKEVSLLLGEIQRFNSHLHLCCLLTYGCLLRPHQEVRTLTWGDFSGDLKHVALSGSRNKSGRNRIVPVPAYVREHLVPQPDGRLNIFSGQTKPFNDDYFKTLWSRYRIVSSLLEPNQTLYSFRHTGAIQVFKLTGSLQALQMVMGHSNMQVTLGYLRGLEVLQLDEAQMPSI